MGNKVTFWCDICGKTVETNTDLEDFAYSRKDAKGKAELCKPCADTLEDFLKAQVQYPNGPA